MTVFTTEGIILQALPFQDDDYILTVFSLDEGMIKFILKKNYYSKKRMGMAPSPLTRAEFSYVKRKSDLFPCRDMDILNPHLSLRQDLDKLEASCDLLQAILASQWPGKPASDLYRLLCAYLEKMPLATDPFVISSSFRLKILKYEGLLKISNLCSVCGCLITTHSHLSAGEFLCSLHKPAMATSFSPEEVFLLEHLTDCPYFSRLATATIPPYLTTQIKHLFKECFDSL